MLKIDVSWEVDVCVEQIKKIDDCGEEASDHREENPMRSTKMEDL